MNRTAIINYRWKCSFNKKITRLWCKSIITNDKKKLKTVLCLILPGVGAFFICHEIIKRGGLDQVIKDFANTGKPVLGICLGMQLLFEEL